MFSYTVVLWEHVIHNIQKKNKNPTNKISKYVWAVVLPYLCKHRLGERKIHEELDDIAAVDEAVIVSVRVLKNFFIFLSVSHWYNPVHRRLETTEDIVWYEMMNTAFSIQQTHSSSSVQTGLLHATRGICESAQWNG